MKISQLLIPVFLLAFSLVTAISKANSDSIEYGENFIVFEAEATTSELGLWVKRTHSDPKYYAGTNIEPVNKTYMEFTGNNMNGGAATSPLTYTFTCPKTANYRLLMRMHQPLLDGEAGDKRNDVYIRLEGDFTSACRYPLDILQTDHKFWGRGVRVWGTNYNLEAHVNGNKVQAPVIYKLIKGEEYTFTMSGRAQGCSIDYLLFYENEMDLKVANSDLAANNPELFRPGGLAYKDSVALVRLNTDLIKIKELGETKNLTATIYPSSALDQSITFTSSNEEVATVSSEGLITAIADGVTTISAISNSGNKRDICMVPVVAKLERFENVETWGVKKSRTYSGENGNSWTYNVLNNNSIDGSKGVYFNRGETGIKSAKIKGGISTFSIKCLNFVDADVERTIEVLVNGGVVGSISKTTSEVYEFRVDSIKIVGDIIISIKNATTNTNNTYPIAFDNLYWTGYDVEIPEEPTTALNNVSLKAEVYPNPFNNEIIVKYRGDRVSQICLIDVQGKIVHTQEMEDQDNGELSLTLSEEIKGGIYYLQLINSTAIKTVKLIKN